MTTADQSYLERNRTHDEIRRNGALGNLNDGIEITTHGISTRLIAWPGNGFQTQSIHVLTHKPGDESEMYQYDMADVAMICLKGQGQVYLRDKWVTINPGDIAYFPSRIPRATRNPKENTNDFVLVTQICPPEFTLYEPAGYYDRQNCVMNFDAIEKAKKQARVGKLSLQNDLKLNTDNPDVRANNLTIPDILAKGALFNAYQGTTFDGIDVPMVLILWPGYGIQRTGFHFGYMPPGSEAVKHTHPVSDECIINWGGYGYGFINDLTVEMGPLDVLLAPCGVHHGGGVHKDAKEPQFPGGFASPPQLDLYAKTPFYKDGKFAEPAWGTLKT